MQDRTCAHCGRGFKQQGQGRPRQYCYTCHPTQRAIGQSDYRKRSEAMKQFKKHGHHPGCCPCLHLRSDRGEIRVGIRIPKKRKPCQYCGLPQRRGSTRRFCSRDCSMAFAAEMAAEAETGSTLLRTCSWCLGSFAPSPQHQDGGCCSYECGIAKRDHLRWQVRLDMSVLAQCTICRQTIYGNVWRQTSGRCADCAADVARAKARRSTKNKNHRRRIAEGDGDDIDVFVLGDRDRWVCHLCRRSVNPSASPMSPGGPTIDHLVPLAKHGTHTWDNVALAHRSCNCARQDADIPILKLVG